MNDHASSARAPSITTRAFAPHGSFVEITGEADYASVPDLRAAIKGEVARGHRHIVVDLSAADLIDCACLAAILSEVEPLREQPDAVVMLAGATGTVERLLAALDFGRVCEIVPDPSEASALAIGPGRTQVQGWRRATNEGPS